MSPGAGTSNKSSQAPADSWHGKRRNSRTPVKHNFYYALEICVHCRIVLTHTPRDSIAATPLQENFPCKLLEFLNSCETIASAIVILRSEGGCLHSHAATHEQHIKRNRADCLRKTMASSPSDIVNDASHTSTGSRLKSRQQGRRIINIYPESLRSTAEWAGLSS